MKHLKYYKENKENNTEYNIPEIEQDIKDILLELEDKNYVCSVQVIESIFNPKYTIVIKIGNGCKTGFYTFGFYRIQDVYLRLVSYLNDWNKRVIKINKQDRLETVDLKDINNLDEDTDLSNGDHSQEFRIQFKSKF